MEHILILSCSTGQGHNSCAQAVKEYFETQQTRCEIRDAFDFISGRLGHLASVWHSRIYRYAPGLFRWGYGYSESHPSVFQEDSPVYRLLTVGSDRMYDYILQEGFDTVICTHVLTALMLTHMLKIHPLPIQTSFIATDYTCSPSMEVSDLQQYFIPASSLTDEFARHGIPRERIHASGIPVRRDFLEHTEKAEAKRRLGLRPDARHLLVTSGSMGCGPIQKLLQGISRQLTPDMEVTVICGTNRKLYRRLRRAYQKQPGIHIVGYTDRMPLYLDAADLYLTKPGGLSVTEAAAKDVPMAFVNAVAGCEDYNLRFFTSCGAAVTTELTDALAELSIRLLRSSEELASMEAALKQTGPADGAAEIFQAMRDGAA